MPHARDYRSEIRSKVGAVALRIFNDFGKAIAVEMYKGTVDATLINLIAHIGRDAAWAHVCEVFGEIKPGRSTPTLVVSNRPVELPCDVGPAA